MLKLTKESYRNWIIAAAVCLFICSALNLVAGDKYSFVDVFIFSLLGVCTFLESRAAATIAFIYYVLGKLIVLDVIISNFIAFVLVMGITLCLLQGMRATYYVKRR